MPSMKWSDLSPLQLGQYGEYYAKMEFTSYKYDVYTSEVDDHGVDFVARNIDTGKFYEVQVKSERNNNTVCIRKDKLVLDEYHLVCLLHFSDNELPFVYIIPATAWNEPNALLVSRDYDDPKKKSNPEWGINLSKKNIPILEKYKSEKFFLG